MLLPIRLATALLLVASWPLAAASFTANSSLDLADDSPGDGLCRSALVPPSTCTLRAAIMEANALPGSHIINLQPGRTYTLTRSGVDDTALNGDLDITKSLIIWCLGCEQRAVLDVNGVGRGIDILGGDVTLAGFDITGAEAATPGEASGGAVAVDLAAGEVMLSQMRLYGNQAAHGGAILNFGAATTLSASEVFDNSITADPGSGSAISNSNVLAIRRSSIHGNAGASPSMAAIYTWKANIDLPGRLLLENSTVSGNIGNGLLIFDSAHTEIYNSTIAGHDRAGMLVTGMHPAVSVRNSLIVRNATGDCQINSADGAYAGSFNLFSDASCSQVAGVSSLQGTNPLLTPLKLRNGGPISTPMHWPRVDSPALSNGSPFQGECQASDQNGIARPQGFNGIVRCDIGAAEVPDDAIFFDSVETL